MKIGVDKNRPKREQHRMTETRLYRIWCNMKGRCYSKTNPRYKEWGGRGITMCAEWKDSFLAFYKWSVANGYSDDLTIDRIDNDEGYYPSNCRWTTLKEQANNTRRCHFVAFNGETHTLSEWAEILGINRKIISDRIIKLKWPIEQALTTPVLTRSQWRSKKGSRVYENRS